MNAAWQPFTTCQAEGLTLVPDGDVRNVSRLMPRMLIDLQNRGQLAAGMTSYDPDRDQILETYKEIGTSSKRFV